MEQKSILEGVTDGDIVAVHNPFEEEFVCKIARSMAMAPRRANPFTGNAEADAFVNSLHQTIDSTGHSFIQHTQQTITFKPGQTINLMGSVAKVAVRQIVKELMQRSGAKRLLSDPHAYMEFESKVVKNKEKILSDLSSETIEEKLQRQIEELNPEMKDVKTDERAFPTISNESIGQDDNDQVKKSSRVGRPAKGHTN